MKSNRLAATLMPALACGATQVPAAPTPAAAVVPLPLSLALKAAKAALAACVAQGLTVTVTVADREGVARVVLLGDGTGVALGGGIPIMHRNVVIAVLGVGGADRGDADVVCAQAGVDAIRNQFE